MEGLQRLNGYGLGKKKNKDTCDLFKQDTYFFSRLKIQSTPWRKSAHP